MQIIFYTENKPKSFKAKNYNAFPHRLIDVHFATVQCM